MRVLITRPREDARRTEEALAARGARVVTEPLMAILPIAGPQVDYTGVQAVLVTSANGVRALAAAHGDRSMPLFAVGDASARVARHAGYATVKSAGGDVSSLAALVAENLSPKDGALLHAAASVAAGDLKSDLERAGFEVRKIQLYEARPAVSLTESLVEGLKSAQIDAAFFFSPRTAATFVTLAKKAGVDNLLGTVTAYALSAAVAEKLAAVAWRAVRVAAAPDQDSLLAVFDADRAAGTLAETRPETGVAKGGGTSMTSGDKNENAEREPEATTERPMPEPATAAEVDAADAESDDSGDDGETHGSSGRAGVIVFLLLVIAGLGGFASLPYWRDKVPEPYRSYLPDLPPSETRALIDGLQQNVEANRAELNRLRAQVKDLSGEVEEVTDTVSPNGASTAAEVTALKERVAALDTRLRALAAGGAAAPGATSDVSADAQHRLDLLAGRTEQQADATKAALSRADARAVALREAVDDLAKRVDTVEATRAEAASVLRLSDRINDVERLARTMVSRHDASLANLLAVVQLRAKAADGQPFDAELRTTRALAEDKAAFDAVAGGFAASAASGVATTAALRHGFDVVSATAARAAAAPEGDSLTDKMIGRVVSLVTVRRIDGKEQGDGVAAILARAERFVDAGDVAGAAKELRTVKNEAAAAVLKPWLERAEARVALDAALSTLTSDALARVAASAMQTPAEPASQKKGG